MTDRKLRLGVAGLGRAFTVMLPTLAHHPRLQLVAAADPRDEARRRFAADFQARTYATVAELCADPEVEAIYIATPHQLHAEHVCLAAAKGKHALVEKPMALTIADCDTMIAAARNAGVRLIIGHSHSFDSPILRAREIIASGAVGKVSMITALNYTDFLYRPRRPEELITEQGGGVLFSQAAHQMDVIRLLGGGRVKSVRAGTGAWDAKRPTEGAYTAFLTFEDGAFASATYSGYAHFDSDEFTGWIGEMGQKKDAASYGAARRALARAKSPDEEATLKAARNYGGPDFVAAPRATDLSHQHFGLVLVSCEKADLRPMPNGVLVYADEAVRLEPLPRPDVPRAEVIDELYDAIFKGRAPVHTGEWALATLEVCLAVLHSSRERQEVALHRQVGLG
jgi:phthalate 4,5-cis-dihydrodiol dehydrogenase